MIPALDVPTRIRSIVATLTFAASLSVGLDHGVAKGMGFQDSCYLTLPQGDVRGLDLGASCSFLGIPYADSPAGGNRWKPPQPRAAWSPSVVDARTGVPQCPQVQLPQGVLLGSEDCLFMNVWTRDLRPAALAPVIVWLHTGAFTGASANFAGSNGRTFAEQTGAVVVAPNYRVGPLGFLAHRALAAEDPTRPTSGNYGLLDQQAALRWVQDNIARFGGDPNNVTLAGTSAGGASVALHLISPGSAGLYHRAILQSAYLSTTRWATHQRRLLTGDAWTTAIGCTDPREVLACMRSKTRDQVLTAMPVGTLQVVEPADRVYWEPVVDGLVVPDQPRALFESGAFHRVPTIIGFNRDEGWGAFITRSFPTGVSLEQYRRLGDERVRPSWIERSRYLPGLEFRLTNGSHGACHSRCAIRLRGTSTRAPSRAHGHSHLHVPGPSMKSMTSPSSTSSTGSSPTSFLATTTSLRSLPSMLSMTSIVCCTTISLATGRDSRLRAIPTAATRFTGPHSSTRPVAGGDPTSTSFWTLRCERPCVSRRLNATSSSPFSWGRFSAVSRLPRSSGEPLRLQHQPRSFDTPFHGRYTVRRSESSP